MQIRNFESSIGGFEEVNKLMRHVYKHKFLIGLFVLVTLLATGFLLKLYKPVYQSSAIIQIEAQTSNVIDLPEVYGVSRTKEYFNTQVHKIQSRVNMVNVIKQFKLWELDEFDPRKKGVFFSLVEKLFGPAGERYIKNTFSDQEGKQNQTELSEDELANLIVAGFSKKVSVKPIRLSQLVVVSFESTDPVLSQKIADAVVQAYINHDREFKFQVAKDANVWLQSRIELLHKNLITAEKKLQTYREQNKVLDVNGSVESIAVDRIKEVSKRLEEARVKLLQLESAYNQINNIKDGDYTSVPAVMKSDSVADARELVADIESRAFEIRSRYSDVHPEIISIKAEVKAARKELESRMKLVVNGVRAEYEITRETVKALDAALNNAKGTLQGLNKKGTKLDELKRDVTLNRQIYELFLKRTKETSTTRDLEATVAHIIDHAGLGVKVKPKALLILALAFLLSLMTGVIAAIRRESLDDTIKGPTDAENKLGVPVLATLPIAMSKGKTPLIAAKPDSFFAEAIRTASTGVSLTSAAAGHQVILVTSSVAGEGKSTFSSNISYALAGAKKVLLIEADMRRSSQIPTLKSNYGLSNFLNDQAELDAVLVKQERSNLTILPAGTLSAMPLDLISSAKMQGLIDAVKKDYDLIIVDTPPIGLVSDAEALLPLVDAVIFLIKSTDTTTSMVTKEINRIQRQNVNLLGLVINQHDFKNAEKYYGEYTPYAKYGYKDYGYGTKKTKNKTRLQQVKTRL